MNKAAIFRAGTPASPLDVCAIDLRGSEGCLVRKVTEKQAASIVESGLGFWRGVHEVRLFDEGVAHNGNPKTWLGNQSAGRIRPSKYGHNQRVCNAWPEEMDKPKSREAKTS